jgi:YidC/Oxa1 family membrane protein insertase
MRELQPEIKKIKQATKGDRQKESTMIMELYKERQISPFGSLGIILVQFVVLIGLYSGLRKVVDNPQAILDFTYSWVANLPWMKTLAQNISQFDATLFGVIDLSKPAISKSGAVYVPALLLVIGSAITQYFQSSQLMPTDKDARKLRHILKDASTGKQAEQSEVNAAIGRSTKFLIPIAILFFTINIASALTLYWFVGGLIALIQQSIILKEDEEELEAGSEKAATDKVIEGEIVEKKPTTKIKTSSKKQTKKRRKR